MSPFIKRYSQTVLISTLIVTGIMWAIFSFSLWTDSDPLTVNCIRRPAESTGMMEAVAGERVIILEDR